MRRDDTMGTDYIEVEASIALGLLSGKLNPKTYYVFDDQLLSLADLQGAFEVVGSEEWKPVDDVKPAHPITLRIEVGRMSRKAVFSTDAVDFVNIIPLPFMITSKDDPSDVLQGGLIPAHALRDGYMVSLPRTESIDVWMPRLKIAKPWIDYVEHGEISLSPGLDYMIAVTDNTDPGLHIDIAQNTMTLSLRNGGGVRFRRNDTSIPVMLCSKGDPGIVLAGWQVSLKEIAATCTLTLPEGCENSDVVVGRFWTNVTRS